VRLLVFDKFVNMRQLFAYVEKNTENEWSEIGKTSLHTLAFTLYTE
jgi:hypothetical protein